MRIIQNDKKIKRLRQVGMYASLAGPVILIAGAWIGINQDGLGLSLVLLAVGFITYQTGQAYQHYSREAEVDFSKTLKTLGDDYTLYHFATPVSHLLIGPAGIWILIPRYVRGVVTYNEERKRWKLEQKGFFKRFLSDGLAKPEIEIITEADQLDRYLEKNWGTKAEIMVNAALVFIGEDIKVKVKNCPVPTLHISKLRKLIKSQEEENKISPDVLSSLHQTFSQ